MGWGKMPKSPPRGLGLGRWLGRGPRGGSLKPGVGRASDPMWRAPIRFVGHAGVCIFLITCKATPQPKPCHTPQTRHSPVGGLQLHVSTHAPQPTPHHTPRS
ncbi:hypothetical protein Hanom_Chr01g00031191 [Helianthus anomalus]